VDLHDYTTRLRAPAQTIEVTPASRMTFARRPSIDISSMPAAVGAEEQVAASDAMDSPLDVPAFLRRSEG
jgi:hypothetical protein